MSESIKVENALELSREIRKIIVNKINLDVPYNEVIDM
jgi:hypothetical protein